ncbi:MAG TPA: DUF4167 domain-containing protein [Novosphingobium sp.]|nr:DUF4167 domain-containing protein [Novosphingobium sp.]
MNNNNRGNNSNNNRRRGRSNNSSNRPQGGQPLNRIDSRARGNAPQLLEKYRKLAQDAHLNGDRVTAEYYLQFADHYFRVLADSRVRQEEQRRPQGERWQEGDAPPREEQDDNGEYMESDFPSFDQPPAYVHTRREREDRPERQDRPERSERQERPRRDERPAQPEQNEFTGQDDAAPEVPATDPVEVDERSAYEPAENPFVRERQPSTRGLRPRRDDRRPRREESDDADGNGSSFDASILPPPITITPADAAAEDEPAAPRRRARRAKPADDAGEALEAVSQD